MASLGRSWLMKGFQTDVLLTNVLENIQQPVSGAIGCSLKGLLIFKCSLFNKGNCLTVVTGLLMFKWIHLEALLSAVNNIQEPLLIHEDRDDWLPVILLPTV